MEPTVEHLAQTIREERHFSPYPPPEPVRELKIDVPGLFALLAQAVKMKACTPYTYRPGIPRDLVLSSWCRLRLAVTKTLCECNLW